VVFFLGGGSSQIFRTRGGQVKNFQCRKIKSHRPPLPHKKWTVPKSRGFLKRSCKLKVMSVNVASHVTNTSQHQNFGFINWVDKVDSFDTVGIKCADLKKKNSCSRFLRLSVITWCRGRSQIVMCWLEWLGGLKCRATGLDASLSFLSTSRRCSRKRSPSLLPVSPKSACYAIDNICGGACKTIGDFNRSLGSCYFVHVPTNSVAPPLPI